MKTSRIKILLTTLLILPGLVLAQTPMPDIPASIGNEAQMALQRGAGYLMKKQLPDGSWRRFGAITALAALALHNNDQLYGDQACKNAVEKARRNILEDVQPDGAICPENRMYANYSTAVCLSTLAILNRPEDIEVMRKARRYLLGEQMDADHAGQPVDEDDKNFGGFGYGGKEPGLIGKMLGRGGDRADLSSTQWALEALYLTQNLDQETAGGTPADVKEGKLAWSKAINFLENVQNLKKDDQEGWVVTDDQDGGFTYLPESEDKREDSYGSMTYGGLKSMLYAKLERDDPRVVAAHGWLTKHYTVDDNPGKGGSGLFYYYQTMAKALSAWGEDELQAADGQSYDWREDLIRKLVALQKPTGEWVNERSGRWQESDPQLVTAYAMIAIQLALKPDALISQSPRNL